MEPSTNILSYSDAPTGSRLIAEEDEHGVTITGPWRATVEIILAATIKLVVCALLLLISVGILIDAVMRAWAWYMAVQLMLLTLWFIYLSILDVKFGVLSPLIVTLTDGWLTIQKPTKHRGYDVWSGEPIEIQAICPTKILPTILPPHVHVRSAAGKSVDISGPYSPAEFEWMALKLNEAMARSRAARQNPNQ